MNFILIFVSFILLNIFACYGFPECCFPPTQYPDVQNIVTCILNCSNSAEEKSDLCSSCFVSKLDSEMLQYLADFNFSMPQMTCQELVQSKRKIYGQLILSWDFRSSFDYSIIFLIEAKNSTINGSWYFVGMTNETIAKITNLETQVQYKFRVTPVTAYSIQLKVLLESDWILIPDSGKSISSPSEIRATSFDLDKNLVSATIEWSASKERPCSYQLYWLPSLGSEYFEQKTVTLPNENFSTILPGLDFETNYTVKISPHEERELRRVFPTQGWFITPSCLSITNGNFSLCAPGLPLNVSVFWSPTALEAVLMWQPPHFSSVSNEVSSYYLTIAEVSEQFESIMQYRDHILLEKNASVITLYDLQPFGLYMFELRAISPGGTGPPAVTELNTKTVRRYTLDFDEAPWHYIIPSSICFLFVLSAAVIHQIIHARRKTKNLIYPNGLADVPDHLLPSLVPSNKIELQNILGHGAFGVVYKGLYAHKKFKEEVAVKTFPAETSTRKKLLNEIDILRLIGRHDHVVSLVGFTLNIDKMYLILEFCALGDLQSYLPRFKKLLMEVKSQQRLSRTISRDPKYGIQLCSYIYQVAVGMEHISSLKLIHRDIAARNILMCSEEHVKIADFGLSKDIYETQNYHSTSQQRLPIKWMAPEAIEKQRFNARTDVWSFGVLMWEIFKFGQEPYLGYPNSEILTLLKNGKRLVKPNTCNQEWYDLMLKCWHADPKRRPSFRELVQKTGDTITTMSNYTRIVNA